MIPVLNHWANVWLDLFGLSLLQNTLFLGLLFLLLTLLRNSDARIKYLLTLAGMIKLFLPPLLPISWLNSSASGTGSAILESGWTVSAVLNQQSQALSPLVLLMSGWFAIGLIFLIRTFYDTWVLYRWTRNVNTLNRSGNLIYSEQVTIPMTIGLLRPYILVPPTYDDLPAEAQNAILAHEQAHIRRKDLWIRLMQRIMITIYFFHPLVWLLNKKIDLYREMICDDIAIDSSPLSAMDYSHLLLGLAETNVSHARPLAAAFQLFESRDRLYTRISYQVSGARKQLASFQKYGLVILIVLIMIPLSWSVRQEFALATGFAKLSNDSNPASLRPTLPLLEQDQETTPIGPLQKSPETPDPDQTFVAYDQPPQPVGGFAAIQRNLSYPETARQKGLEGRVVLNIRIDASGTIQDTRVLKSLGDPACDRAAIEAVKSVEWKPASSKGKPVTVWVGIPIVFKL
jgi:TonB family protein